MPSVEERRLAEELRALLNGERRRRRLPELAAAPALDELAALHAAEMARRRQVTHYSHETGFATRTRVRLAFPGVFRFAENVARNRTITAAHEALLASPGHRLNRLDPDFTHVGIGVARASPHELYVTELFVRAPEPAVLARIHRLYTRVPPDVLPRDEPRHGEVVDERVTVGAPPANGPEALTAEGIEAYARGRYEEAITLFEQALRQRPDYAYARYDLARALMATGLPEAAIEQLDRYLQQVGEDLDARHTLGSAQLLAGRYAEAEATFRRLLGVRPRSANGWYNLGLALEYQERLAEAERAYAQALHLDPSLAEAVAALARLRRRR